MQVVYKLHHFGLPTSRAVYNTPYISTMRSKHVANYRSISAGRRKHHPSGIDTYFVDYFGELVLAAVYKSFWDKVVERLRILLHQIAGKHIVPG